MRSLPKPVFAAFVALLLVASSDAFESPLSDETVRNAYFLGQHHDASTESALKPYLHALPPPKEGPYISDIRLLTPYAQIIDESNSHPGSYSAQQAAADYRSRSDTIVLRVHIQFTATYNYIETTRNHGDTQKGISVRPDDFWKTFKVGLSQNDQWIEPQSRDGEPTYADNPDGSTALSGAYIWLTYDARDVASDSATAEVFTPDDQHTTTTFDLATLR
jgi:hypothetical protein